MAAPTLVERQTPVGSRLKTGHPTLYAFSADPDVSIWETAAKPPGWEGGDKIPTTTYHNEDLRTFAARVLKEMTDGEMTVAYDPRCYPQIRALINVEGIVTVHFPNGSALSFYGYLQNFEPDDTSEEEMPTASCTIVATNTDPATGTEELPVYFPASGTGTGT